MSYNLNSSYLLLLLLPGTSFRRRLLPSVCVLCFVARATSTVFSYFVCFLVQRRTVLRQFHRDQKTFLCLHRAERCVHSER